MKKLCIVGGVILVLTMTLILVILPSFKNSDKVQNLPFVDDEMKNTLVNTTVHHGIIEETEDFRLNCLGQIGWLNIGYTGYYTTLADVKLCKNLHTLYIGFPKTDSGNTYWKNWCEKPKPESCERISQIEAELAEILQECTQLNSLYIRNDEGTCEFKSLDFLEYGGNLKALWLRNQRDIDFSSIYNCTSLSLLSLSSSDIRDLDGIGALDKLETLDIRYTDISEAGDIIYLNNLKALDVEGTPLAENEEELAIIREALPDVEIYFGRYN